MRTGRLFTALLALCLVALASISPATAGGHYGHGYRDAVETRVVIHRVYYPRYRHVYRLHSAEDPYAYRYEPRGYYPYYNSRYWRRPAYRVYQPYAVEHPPYYRAWGAKKRRYHHRRWHDEHHGRIRHGHW